jgi:hypothetical protein
MGIKEQWLVLKRPFKTLQGRCHAITAVKELVAAPSFPYLLSVYRYIHTIFKASFCRFFLYSHWKISDNPSHISFAPSPRTVKKNFQCLLSWLLWVGGPSLGSKTIGVAHNQRFDYAWQKLYTLVMNER